jgi:hypothetical protein
MRRFALLTPFLFTLASLLQLNYIALIVVSPDQILRPLVILWALLFILLWPAYWVTHDWNWAALLLTIFVAGFYFSSSFFSAMLLFTIMVGVIYLSFLFIRKVKVNAVHVAYLLAGVSIFFIGYSIFLTSGMLSRVPWDDYQQAVYEAKNYSLDSFPVSSVNRDIYFIILDGYARSDILQEMYGFNNSEFVTYLEEQGFVVPVSSVSNYPATHLSIASMLNMDYMGGFSPDLDESYNRWLMSPFIDHSRVRALLEQQGYTTVSISTNWSITDNITTSAYFHPYPVMLSDFEGFILDTTPLNLFEPLLGKFASVPSFETQRKVILYNFDTLATLPEFPGPKFVFAHIISPHPPFVFDRNGEPADVSDSFSFKDANEYSGSQEEYRQRYLDQLQFVNDNLRKAIEAILAKSKTPPIIILQADHGSGMLVDFASSKNTCIKERFSPFAAYYLPDLVDYSIPADVSAVNIFRMIFNEYFGADLPILESRQYFYNKPVSFYEFEDVTTRLDDECKRP